MDFTFTEIYKALPSGGLYLGYLGSGMGPKIAK